MTPAAARPIALCAVLVTTGLRAIHAQTAASHVRFNPNELSLRVGEQRQVRPIAVDRFGSPIVGAAFEFTSSDWAVATVSADGLISALAAGEVTITARYGTGPGSRTDRLRLRVTGEGGAPAPEAAPVVPGAVVSRLRVMPEEARIRVGERLALRVEAIDSYGSPIPGFQGAFTSDDPRVATVTNAGVVTAVSAGEATITLAAGTGPASRRARVRLVVVR